MDCLSSIYLLTIGHKLRSHKGPWHVIDVITGFGSSFLTSAKGQLEGATTQVEDGLPLKSPLLISRPKSNTRDWLFL